MVIKRNEKTGKYYIAPSPKEFYEAKTPSSSGSSSSGSSSSGSSNAFLDLLDKNKQQTDAKLAVIAPNYTPPKTPSSSGSSSRTQAETTAQINRVSSIATSEQQIASINHGAAATTALNINQVSSRSNTASNDFLGRVKTNAQTNTQSVWTPTPREVADAAGSGRVTPEVAMNAQRKILGDQIKAAAEDDIRKFADQLGDKNKAAYSESLALEEDKLKSKFNDIQNRINNGGDYNKLTKEFELYQKSANKRLETKANSLDASAQTSINNFSKEWANTRGKSMENSAGVILRSTDRLGRLSFKEQKKRFTSAFIPGAVVGAGAAGVIQATGLTLSKAAGATITGVAAAGSVGVGYATAGYDVYKGNLARDEFATEGGTRAVEGGVSFLGGFSGAVAGSVAYSSASNLIRTGTFKGIKTLDRELAKQAYEKNGLKMKAVNGEITEGSIKKLSIDSQGKQTLLSESKAGNVIRKSTYTPETKGLSAAEIKALGKFKLKIEVYSVYDRAGNSIKTIEVAKITGRAPITKISHGADQVTSFGSGQLKGGSSTINRVSIKKTGLGFKDRLTLSGQTQARGVDEIGVEKLTGVGETAKAGSLRLEVGTGKATSLLRYNPKTKILDLSPQISKGSSSIFSVKSGSNVGLVRRGDLIGGAKTTTYKDVFGVGSTRGGNTQESFFNFFKGDPSRSIKGLGGSGGGSSGDLKLLQGATQINRLSAPTPVLSATTKGAGLGIITRTPITTASTILAPPSLSQGSQVRNSLYSPAPRTQLKPLNKTAIATERLLFDRAAPKSEGLFRSRGGGGNSLFAPIQKPITKPIQNQKPIQRQKPNTTQLINSPVASGLGGLSSGAFAAGGFGFGGGLGFLGRVKVGGGGIGRKERGGLFGKTRYSASLGSVLTGYEKKGDSKRLSKQTFSGLGLRPVLLTGKKDDKKKKKKKKK